MIFQTHFSMIAVDEMREMSRSVKKISGAVSFLMYRLKIVLCQIPAWQRRISITLLFLWQERYIFALSEPNPIF